MVLAPRAALARLIEEFRLGTPPGLQWGKTTLASALSYAIADALHTSPGPVLAPLTTLLVIQVTMYKTVTQSFERVASVLAGVLVAVGVASVLPLTWWSLGAVVGVSLVVGRTIRLGSQLPEVPISAMLILAVGGAEVVALARVYETLIGAAVGLMVNVVIAPPLYIQPASEAIRRLTERITGFMREEAAALRRGWARTDADRWLNEARRLSGDVFRTDELLAQAEEGVRLNPRQARARERQPRLRQGLTGLERCYLTLRELNRTLLDRTFFVPEEEQHKAYEEDVREALADILEAAADAVYELGRIALAASDEEAGDRSRLEEHLANLERCRNHLKTLLIVDPSVHPGAWSQHGSLLAAVDRMRVEVQSAARPPDEDARQSTPLTKRQREAIQKLLNEPKRLIEEPKRRWTRRRRRGET